MTHPCRLAGLLAAAALLLAGCSARPPTCDPDQIAEAVRAVESERLSTLGLAALDRFQETWNTRDSRVWATSLHFPHVRPSPGAFGLSPTAEDYARATAGVFERLIAAGWHRSQWDSRRVLHVSPDKMHIAGQYTRRSDSGDDISTQQVTYIVTRQGERWGIQSRFGTGAVRAGEQADPDAQAARATVEAYFDAFNSLDPEVWADTLHFPQVRLSLSGLDLWATREDFLAGTEPGRQRAWAGSKLESVETVQTGSAGANVVVRYSRLSAQGETLASYDAVYLATRRDGRWGIQARSTCAP